MNGAFLKLSPLCVLISDLAVNNQCIKLRQRFKSLTPKFDEMMLNILQSGERMPAIEMINKKNKHIEYHIANQFGLCL